MAKQQNKSIILRDDAAIKYSLKLHSSLPKYPTQSDFIFDCVTHYLSITKKGSINIDEILISKQDLKTMFGEKLTDPSFVKQLKEVIRQMIELGSIIKKDEDVLLINRDSLTEIYKIV